MTQQKMKEDGLDRSVSNNKISSGTLSELRVETVILSCNKAVVSMTDGVRNSKTC